MKYNYDIDVLRIFNKCDDLIFSINNNVWSGLSKDNFIKKFEKFSNEYKYIINKQIKILNEIQITFIKYDKLKKELKSKNKLLNIYNEKIKNIEMTGNIFNDINYINLTNNINNVKKNISNITTLMNKSKINILEEINDIKKLSVHTTKDSKLLNNAIYKTNSESVNITIPSRNSAPVTTDGTPNKWYGQDNWYGRGENAKRGNINQCTGYAYGRFNEIAEANGTKILTGNMGNGQDFYLMGKNAGYETSNDINDIREGDTISWAYGNYGHVAVIENLERDNNGNIVSVVISEGNMTGDPNSKGACHYHKQTFSGNDALNKLATRTIVKNKQSTFVGLVHQTHNKE